MTDDPTIKTAKHLTEICRLYPQLGSQAANRGANRQMPGGDAMVMLSPGADLAAYRYRQMSAIMGRIDVPVDDTEGDPDSVLQVLAYWANEARAERGELTDLPATITRCADYLRQILDWAFNEDGHEFDADAMRADLGKVRARMEAILSEGYRPELGVPCMYDECSGERIRRDIDHNGVRTDWYCSNCRREWDDDAYQLNVAKWAAAQNLAEIDGKMWSTISYAANQVGRSVKTIRTWISAGSVPKACIVRGRRKDFVPIDDVRAEHKRAKERKRGAA